MNIETVLVPKNIFNLKDEVQRKSYVPQPVNRMIHSVHKVYCGVLADGRRK